MRGTFANIRLRNELAPGTEGPWTTHLPSGEVLSVFDAAERYRSEGVPLAVLAGKEYGSGSSRDWAAKGPSLLGVRFVIAESFERIHRSNLVGMGVLPLQFRAGRLPRPRSASRARERYAVRGLSGGVDARTRRHGGGGARRTEAWSRSSPCSASTVPPRSSSSDPVGSCASCSATCSPAERSIPVGYSTEPGVVVCRARYAAASARRATSSLDRMLDT